MQKPTNVELISLYDSWLTVIVKTEFLDDYQANYLKTWLTDAIKYDTTIENSEKFTMLLNELIDLIQEETF